MKKMLITSLLITGFALNADQLPNKNKEKINNRINQAYYTINTPVTGHNFKEKKQLLSELYSLYWNAKLDHSSYESSYLLKTIQDLDRQILAENKKIIADAGLTYFTPTCSFKFPQDGQKRLCKLLNAGNYNTTNETNAFAIASSQKQMMSFQGNILLEMINAITENRNASYEDKQTAKALIAVLVAQKNSDSFLAQDQHGNALTAKTIINKVCNLTDVENFFTALQRHGHRNV